MAKLRELTKENVIEVLEAARGIYPIKVNADGKIFDTVNGSSYFSVLDDESKDVVVSRVKNRLLNASINLQNTLKEDGQPSKVIEIEVAKLISSDYELNAMSIDAFNGLESDLI